MLTKFDDIVQLLFAKNKQILKVAVVAAEDETIIDSLLQAQDNHIAEPVFIGDVHRIREIIKTLGRNPSTFDIVNSSKNNASQCAVDLIKDGSVHVLMKGLLETREFLGPVVKKENDLRLGETISHLAFFELPNYHKLLMTSDGGMIMYPSLHDKKNIIDNATMAFHAMGYELPKHAVLCAIETVNPKMIETVEAAELQQMNRDGLIQGCIVEGPISYDVAMSSKIAEHKGYQSPNVGDFDCLIMPNIQAGNILGKCFTVTANAMMAGVVVGAKAPIVMTSRGADAKEKFYSIATAALIAAGIQ
ncbi:MAG: phosphate acyltransferase [Christensenellales bacterium]|jgi:phosphate butyryltransferase